MKRIVGTVCAVVVAVALAGCSTMTPTSYAPYADNNVALRKHEGVSVSVGSLSDTSNFSANCRLMGPITASGNRSIAQFVQDSFNDEFKFAAIHGSDTVLQGELTHAEFSSTSGLTNGWWILRVTLRNPDNGSSLTADARYDFPSGFDAMTACTQTAQALTPAVQRLVNSAVSKPEFAKLIAR